MILSQPELVESYAYANDYILVKAIAISARINFPWHTPPNDHGADFTHFPAITKAVEYAYKEAGITDIYDINKIFYCFYFTLIFIITFSLESLP